VADTFIGNYENIDNHEILWITNSNGRHTTLNKMFQLAYGSTYLNGKLPLEEVVFYFVTLQEITNSHNVKINYFNSVAFM